MFAKQSKIAQNSLQRFWLIGDTKQKECQMPSYTTQSLAKKFAISSQTVRNAAKRAGIQASKAQNGRSYVFTQEQAEKIAAELKRPFDVDDDEDATVEETSMQEDLREQLRQKDAQIASLLATIQEQAKALASNSAANQIIAASENKDILLISEKTDSGTSARPITRLDYLKAFFTGKIGSDD